jgi:hypothetical protein
MYIARYHCDWLMANGSRSNVLQTMPLQDRKLQPSLELCQVINTLGYLSSYCSRSLNSGVFLLVFPVLANSSFIITVCAEREEPPLQQCVFLT